MENKTNFEGMKQFMLESEEMRKVVGGLDDNDNYNYSTTTSTGPYCHDGIKIWCVADGDYD